MMQDMYTAMGISPEVYEYGEQTLVSLKDRFDEIDKTAEYNQLKVLKAMQDCRVSEACLLGTTGYGYNDLGRDTHSSSVLRHLGQDHGVSRDPGVVAHLDGAQHLGPAAD